MEQLQVPPHSQKMQAPDMGAPAGDASVSSPEHEHVTPDPLVEEDRCPALQLQRLSYPRMLQASVLGCFFTTLGLIVLGIGESGSTVSLNVLGFRALAWLLLYQIPVQGIAIPNVRAFTAFGIEADERCLSWCFHPGFSPDRLRASALSRGTGSGLKAFLCPFLLHGLWLAVYVVLTCVPVHPQYHHLGYVGIYGIGHIAVIAIGDCLGPKLAPGRHHRYTDQSGPPALGLAIMGFFVGVSGFAISKRYLGAWFGGFVAVFLFLYELLGTVAICRFYANEFIKQQDARAAYSGSPQAMTPSITIALISCMAEGARITMLVAAAAHDPEDTGYTVALFATFVIQIISRAGYADAMFYGKTGVDRVPNGRLLLRTCRFQSGYPRMLVICSFALARLALGKAPTPNSTVSKVVMLTFLEGVLEDLAIVGLRHLGYTIEAERSFRTLTSVVPMPTSKAEDPETDVELFDYGFGPFAVLPLWAHFSAVMISQFHTVLFVIIFCGGVPSVLGFCDTGYTGVERGILWWPIKAGSEMCH